MSKGTKQVKLTAKERIDALEAHALEVNDRFGAVVNEFERLKGIILSLGKKLNATIAAGENENGLSNDTVNKIMTEENVDKMKVQVSMMIEHGYLVESGDGVVVENSFVVGRELDEEKNVVNPRIQFSMAHIDNDKTKEKILNMKVGEVIKPDNVEDGELSIEIMEIYNTVDQTAEENTEGLEIEAQETK